jgi:hypothetical protein
MDAGRPAALSLRPGADGCFPSRVTGGGIDLDDRNGFVTALVLRTLGPSAPAILGPWHETALGALEACRDPLTGGFRFWPKDARPAWAPDLPCDADDTALMAVALWRGGRMDLDQLRRLACRTVVCHRLQSTVQPGPSWPRIGAFKTWMRGGAEPAMADCTVNANVLMMLSVARLRAVPGYAQACAMIADGVAWTGEDARRAASLSPFYPAAGELVMAVEEAVAAGVSELAPVRAMMEEAPLWRRLRAESCGEAPVICGSPYGLMRWTSAAVGQARRLVSGRSAPVPDPDGSGRHAPDCTPAPAPC